jgi:hypothetical protein
MERRGLVLPFNPYPCLINDLGIWRLGCVMEYSCIRIKNISI